MRQDSRDERYKYECILYRRRDEFSLCIQFMCVIQKAASCLRGTINISASRVAVTRQRDASHRRALYIPVVVAFATNTYNSSLVSVTNFSLNGSTNSSIMFAGDCAAVAINISRENALGGAYAGTEAVNVEVVPGFEGPRGNDIRWRQGAESHVDTRYGKKLLYERMFTKWRNCPYEASMFRTRSIMINCIELLLMRCEFP